MHMNIVDLCIVLLVFITVIRGAEIGLVRQATSFIGLVVGLVGGSLLASALNATAVIGLIIIGLSVLITTIVSEYAGLKLTQAVHKLNIHTIDRVLGAGIGCAICLSFVWFGSALVSAVPSFALQRDVRDSRIIAWLDQQLPPPTDIMGWLEQTLARTHIPQILSELEPQLPNTDAELPDVGTFNAAVSAAQASVVEIEGRSCSGISVGSGFVAQDGIVVTNAHVVAGMLRPYVQDDNGRHRAQIINFDPDLDIAVLRVSNLAGSPLKLVDATVPVGTDGVVLGYPGGGPLKVSPSVVVERFTAIGRDIYEESANKRDVYALKADVNPGNSGGPLLNSSASVMGVVFARSTSYTQVGYALTMPNVIEELTQAQTNPTIGESARCTPGD
jgi:S1-C subfamily serine protease